MPIILGRPFLATSNAIINCRNGVMQLTFGNMKMELNIFHLNRKHVHPEEEGPEEVCQIDTNVEEHCAQKLQKELRNDAYLNSKISKERSKKWHDQMVARKNFQKRDKVLLYDSKLHIFMGKLRSRWISPFTIHQVYPNGAVELLSSNESQNFKVNGHRLKPYAVPLNQTRRSSSSLSLKMLEELGWVDSVSPEPVESILFLF